MNVKASRTYDTNLIKAIITHPELWATVAEDGHEKEGYYPDLTGACWVLMEVGGNPIGLYSFNAHNSVTVEIHAHVLPAFRSKYSDKTGKAALRWIYDNAPEYKKVIAQVPVIYENVKKFTCGFGFQVEGVNRASYLKGGEILDRWLLGITRDEIKEVLA